MTIAGDKSPTMTLVSLRHPLDQENGGGNMSLLSAIGTIATPVYLPAVVTPLTRNSNIEKFTLIRVGTLGNTTHVQSQGLSAYRLH